jgi:hypothetical protein
VTIAHSSLLLLLCVSSSHRTMICNYVHKHTVHVVVLLTVIVSHILHVSTASLGPFYMYYCYVYTHTVVACMMMYHCSTESTANPRGTDNTTASRHKPLVEAPTVIWNEVLCIMYIIDAYVHTCVCIFYTHL